MRFQQFLNDAREEDKPRRIILRGIATGKQVSKKDAEANIKKLARVVPDKPEIKRACDAILQMRQEIAEAEEALRQQQSKITEIRSKAQVAFNVLQQEVENLDDVVVEYKDMLMSTVIAKPQVAVSWKSFAEEVFNLLSDDIKPLFEELLQEYRKLAELKSEEGSVKDLAILSQADARKDEGMKDAALSALSKLKSMYDSLINRAKETFRPKVNAVRAKIATLGKKADEMRKNND